MTKSNRLGMYADCRKVLDAALAAGGGEYECPDHGAAVHWRQRAYRFRKLYATTLGEKAESPYDILVMPRIPDDSGTVRIVVRQQAGVFRPLEGGTPFTPKGVDELEAAALKLSQELDGDVI